MTSRPVPRIERILKGLSVPQIALVQDLVDQDVANLQGIDWPSRRCQPHDWKSSES